MAYLELLEYGKDYMQSAELEILQQLAKVYRQTYKQVEKEIKAFNADLTEENKLAEAQKYNRLVNLKREIAKEYKKLTDKSIELTKDFSEFSYQTAFEQTWFNVEKTIGQNVSFGIPPVDAIRASVYSAYSGAAFPYRFGKLYTTTVDKIAESITRGLAAGLPYKTTAFEIQKWFNNSYADAVRVVRTESTRNFSEGNQYAYYQAKKNGIEGVETWLSTFDGRTRDNHAKLNGQEAKNGFFRIDGMKSRGPGLWGVASEDINCRCTTYYKLSGEDYSPDWKYAQWKQSFEDWKGEKPTYNKTI